MAATDDPFNCRLQFTRLLSRLNASAGASKQCAQFALRNKELDEDLFSVIVEQLQSVPSPPHTHPCTDADVPRMTAR